MSLINSPSDFNKWQVNSGSRFTSTLSVESYVNAKIWTKNLLRDIPQSLKELIVKDINKQKSIVHIDCENIDVMIKELNRVKERQKKRFEMLRKEDFFLAFRYLHKLTYKR
jgi:hypothetical protein